MRILVALATGYWRHLNTDLNSYPYTDPNTDMYTDLNSYPYSDAGTGRGTTSTSNEDISSILLLAMATSVCASERRPKFGSVYRSVYVYRIQMACRRATKLF